MKPKPRHLAREYAEQFADVAVVAAYSTRPPYPAALFEQLASLLPASSRRALELGSGTGDLTFSLLPHVESLDAVEPSLPMLHTALARAGEHTPTLRWLYADAESARLSEGKYGLVVAAESIHWMIWEVVLPKVARALTADGLLAIVHDRRLIDPPWGAELQALIAEFSTNRDYRAYDVVSELSGRGLFRELGRRSFCDSFTQSLDGYVESFHSRNGFSRDRMPADRARDFDARLRDLVLQHQPDGAVSGQVRTNVVWGRALAG
jgi:SAM-dependent methyltransferase